MAILIVEHRGNVEGASLSGRVLIGRRPSNHVVVDDPAVSRIHAWIDTADRRFCITDAGSRTGTFVNGERVRGTKVPLRHGDRITVGPASLLFRTDGSLPAGVSQLNFADRAASPGTDQPDGGILFDCTCCGAPLWVGSDLAGRLGKCRFCGTVIRIPASPIEPRATTALPAKPRTSAEPSTVPAETTATADTCGICQSPIAPGEAGTTCSSCGLTFHADCWTENFGCAAYGCAQVNALLPKGEPEAANPLIAEGPPDETSVSDFLPDESAASAPRIPAEHALLAGSVASLLIGALAFGVPSLITLVASLVYLKRQRRVRVIRSSKVLLAAIALSLLGMAVGVAVSYLWWLAGDAPSADDIGVWNLNP
jgi:hypothetical protein